MANVVMIKYKVLPEGRGGVISLKRRPRVADLLKELGMSPDSVIVTVNGEVVAEDYVLDGEASVIIYRVVSGG